ncbi:TetR/AcrR family transcriptional regulator [Streptomyces boninensis]|uniref:TetR/AcrR family transcriptional regulator n=1 Tax=Streptomyces boninensis TaxID=2039455 RepID=UPI003B214246
MAQRGPYAKGVAKREEILDKALEIVATAGYSRTTVRELAEGVGLSQTGLLHYFGSKEELFKEILRRRDERDRAAFGFPAEGEREPHGPDTAVPDLRAATVRVVEHNAEVPGLVQLFSRFTSEAAEAGHPAHDYVRERYARTRTTFAAAIARLQRDGQLPPELDPERLAVLTAAVLDGLQLQWMYDPGVDMADHLACFWELVGGRPAGEHGTGGANGTG